VAGRGDPEAKSLRIFGNPRLGRGHTTTATAQNRRQPHTIATVTVACAKKPQGFTLIAEVGAVVFGPTQAATKKATTMYEPWLLTRARAKSSLASQAWLGIKNTEYPGGCNHLVSRLIVPPAASLRREDVCIWRDRAGAETGNKESCRRSQLRWRGCPRRSRGGDHGCGTMDGTKAMSSDGEHIGKISDTMLDVRQRSHCLAVLAEGGFLVMGSNLHAIPWSVLTLDADEKCFVVDILAQRLKDDPGFDQDHRLTTEDAKW
jgi:hypothetical protein